MSFLKKLFGAKGTGVSKGAFSPIEHKGYSITPSPIHENGQWRLQADISREVEGEVLTHRLIRADLLPSMEQAADASIQKAKQMIAEQGDGLFKS